MIAVAEEGKSVRDELDSVLRDLYSTVADLQGLIDAERQEGGGDHEQPS